MITKGEYRMNSFMDLTDQDRLVLESCKVLLDGLAEYLGEGYELILHSLENLDASVIKIINGHYTGRKEGAPITDLALSMLTKISQQDTQKAECYFCKNNSGAVLKSATIPIIGENQRIIGLLCINLHTEIPFLKMISTFFPGASASDTQQETFAQNSDDLICQTLESARTTVMNTPSITTANRNKEIVTILYHKGIFNMKDSVVKVASLLGISKNTVYMHIRNINKQI